VIGYANPSGRRIEKGAAFCTDAGGLDRSDERCARYEGNQSAFAGDGADQMQTATPRGRR